MSSDRQTFDLALAAVNDLHQARLPISEVNIDVAMPSTSTTAKPRTAPAPNNHSTTPAIAAVMLESTIAERARSKPAEIAARGDTPLRSSSRMRS